MVQNVAERGNLSDDVTVQNRVSGTFVRPIVRNCAFLGGFEFSLGGAQGTAQFEIVG
jgi:hypothetical protein